MDDAATILAQEQRSSGNVPFKASVLLIIMLWAATHLFTINWGLPTIAEYAPDGIPVISGKNALESWSEHINFPPLHHMLLAAIFGKVPVCHGQDAAAEIAGNFILKYRIIGAIMALGTALLIFSAANHLWPGQLAALAASAIFLLNPLSLFYSHTTNLEQPYVFWMSASAFVIWRAAAKPSSGAQGFLCHLFAGILMGLAVCTKDMAYATLLLPLLVVIVHLIKTGGLWRCAVPAFAGWLAGGIAVVVTVYLLAGGWNAFSQHLQWITGEGSKPFAQVDAGVWGRFVLGYECLLSFLRICEPPLLFMIFCGLLAHGIDRRSEAAAARLGLILLCGWVSFSLLFSQMVRYVHDRYYLPLVPLLALLGAWSLRKLWGMGRLGRGGVVIAVALSLLIAVQLLVQLACDNRSQLQRKMAALQTSAGRELRIAADAWSMWVSYEKKQDHVVVRKVIRDWRQSNYGQISTSTFSLELTPLAFEIGRPEVVVLSAETPEKHEFLKNKGFVLFDELIPVGQLVYAFFKYDSPSFFIYTLESKDALSLKKGELPSYDEQLQVFQACLMDSHLAAMAVQKFGVIADDFTSPDIKTYGLQPRVLLLAATSYAKVGRVDNARAICDYLADIVKDAGFLQDVAMIRKMLDGEKATN